MQKVIHFPGKLIRTKSYFSKRRQNGSLICFCFAVKQYGTRILWREDGTSELFGEVETNETENFKRIMGSNVLVIIVADIILHHTIFVQSNQCGILVHYFIFTHSTPYTNSLMPTLYNMEQDEKYVTLIRTIMGQTEWCNLHASSTQSHVHIMSSYIYISYDIQ